MLIKYIKKAFSGEKRNACPINRTHVPKVKTHTTIIMLFVDGKNVSLRRAKTGVLRKTVWVTIEVATEWGDTTL